MTDEIERKAKVLLDAAYDYWGECRKNKKFGAVRWLEDHNGHVVIFTRSEYRSKLLENITEEYREGEITYFSQELINTLENGVLKEKILRCGNIIAAMGEDAGNAQRNINELRAKIDEMEKCKG